MHKFQQAFGNRLSRNHIISKSWTALSSFSITTPPNDNDNVATVVFLRHGQSTWNKIPTFSGWCDVPLTELGVDQAKEAGTLLNNRGYHFDIAYTSELQRARRTCEAVVESLDEETPIVSAWQLNERHYGSLQGRAKNDPSLIAEYGESQMTSWRRDFDAAPPPMNECHPYYEPPPAPLTESLADCQARILKYWHQTLVPSLRSGDSTLVVAHANTIRAMIAYLDGLRPEDVPKIHIPNSVPCVFEIDLVKGIAVDTVTARADFSSRGHWLLSEANQRRIVEKLGGCSESFAQSIFSAWDKNADGVLTHEELKIGIYTWKNDDRALAVLVGKVWEELHRVGESGPITVEKFKRYALLSAKKHNLPFFLDD